MNTVGYYDVFLFNLDGDVMYSIAKESDYATNVKTGPYRNSGLSRAFAEAVSGDVGQVYGVDFSPYAPSNGIASAFMATPVVNPTGQIIGVVGIQIPSDQIDQIMHNPNGLGMTGEIYVVGEDRLTRTPSRFDDGHETLEATDTLAQTEVTSTMDAMVWPETVGISGAPVLAYRKQLKVLGNNWQIIGEIELAELNAPVIAIRNKMGLLTLVVGIFSTFVGWLIARSFVDPIARVAKAMQSVSEKNYNVD